MGQYREGINGSIVLCQESEGTWFTRKFTILNRFNDGNSVLCYEAMHGKSGKGVLKEFYPSAITTGTREEDNQLNVLSFLNANNADYRLLRKEYLKSYELLLEARKNSKSGDLATFIPNFEIYQGWNEKGFPIDTSYIWTPDNKLTTFEQVIQDCWQQGGMDADESVLLFVRIIMTLTRCVCALHQEGLIHRDIKPKNFGFVSRHNEILVDTLSMFDIDTICSVYDHPRTAMGSRGFMDIEQLKLGLSTQSDIYSIGATLYYALVQPRDEKGRMVGFADDQLNSIQENVLASDLIRRCSPSVKQFVPPLSAIMKKCLNPRKDRYACCEDLEKDLKPVLRGLYSAVMLGTDGVHSESSVQDETEVITQESWQMMQVFLTHLYEHPLFEMLQEGEKELRVAIAGFDDRAQTFLDLCLQMGQMKNIELDIRVLSFSPQQTESYLARRPALKKFLTFDADRAQENDYGALHFVTLQPSLSFKDQLNQIMTNILFDGNKAPHYAFFCLQDDAAAMNIASRYLRWIERSGIDTISCFAWNSAEKQPQAQDRLIPVFVNENAEEKEAWKELERMGLNTHLIWKQDLNQDEEQLMEEYLEPYNHQSSLLAALYQLYKMFSIGIDLRRQSAEEAADIYSSMIEADADDDLDEEELEEIRQMNAELADLEHRRWAFEKACSGWQPFDDIRDCAVRKTRDDEARRHLCLVRSIPGFSLMNTENGSLWEECSEEQMNGLDELDRVSLQVHYRYQNEAGETRKTDLIHGSLVRGIRELLRDNKPVLNVFEEWQNAARELWNGDSSRIGVYEWQRKVFLGTLSQLSAEERVLVKEQADLFDLKFYPIIGALERRDFKANDLALVKNTPFILTYDRNTTLVIPMQTGGNTSLFANAAAAVAVNPGKIVYLALIRSRREAEACLQALKTAKTLFERKKLNAGIELLIAHSSSITSSFMEAYEAQLSAVDPSLPEHVQWESIEGGFSFDDALRKRIDEEKEKASRFGLEKNSTMLAARMEGANLFPFSSTYTYDIKNQVFDSSFYRCTFAYITRKPHFGVQDMIRITDSDFTQEPMADSFGDYQTLWNRLMETPALWRRFCLWLKEETAKKDFLVSFEAGSEDPDDSSVPVYSWTLPEACYDGILSVLDTLKENRIISQDSSVRVSSYFMCQVQVRAPSVYRDSLDKLFTSVYPLMVRGALQTRLHLGSLKLEISFNQMLADQIILPLEHAQEFLDFLYFMEDRGYIASLRVKENVVSFAFISGNVKTLMTDPNAIQEIYLTQKLRETGLFDDIASRIRISWSGSGFENYLSCAATAGYKSFFIMCSCEPVLKQEDYFSLEVTASRFGINTIPVMMNFYLSPRPLAQNRSEKVRKESEAHFGIATLRDRDDLAGLKEYFEHLMLSRQTDQL